jgi:hypothetical protein
MISEESKCFDNKVLKIWGDLGLFGLVTIDTFMMMLVCILISTYLGIEMFWFGVIFGIVSLISAIVGIKAGYFEINNLINVYIFEAMSEEESEFVKRCEGRNPIRSNLVKYGHLFIG